MTLVLAGFGFGQLGRAVTPPAAPTAERWQSSPDPEGPATTVSDDRPNGVGIPPGPDPTERRDDETDRPDEATLDEQAKVARLVIDDLGISAPIDRVGSADGELLLPDHLDRVGQWAGGANPGDGRGTVLIAGHVALNGTPGAGSAGIPCNRVPAS